MTARIYKIRDRKTGLFSRGGLEPRFDARGKSWSGLGPLKCHLLQFTDRGTTTVQRRIPETWEVVAFEVVTIEGQPVSAREVAVESEARRKERYARAAEVAREWRRKALEAELEKLKAER